MRKFVIFSLVGVAIIGALIVVLVYLQMKETKSFSPEEEVSYKQKDLELKVLYNRPYKKDREIFGALVPFDQVWRTGANEATTFEANKDIKIENKTLKAGKYSLWAIPGREKWTVIFNSEYGQWGINSKGDANRNPENDVLTVDVMPVVQDQVFEQFTISFNESGEDIEMVLAWDKTLVIIPIEY
ncbi:MAG TPA: DUF2911 domain-containing protein [Chryseosolibacter sp.]|nr:DUF2911 domain-containing protein [Chryseosolibacter sp.]